MERDFIKTTKDEKGNYQISVLGKDVLNGKKADFLIAAGALGAAAVAGFKIATTNVSAESSPTSHNVNTTQKAPEVLWSCIKSDQLDPNGYQPEKVEFKRERNRWEAKDGSPRTLTEEIIPTKDQTTEISVIPVPVRKTSVDGLASGPAGIAYQPICPTESAK